MAELTEWQLQLRGERIGLEPLTEEMSAQSSSRALIRFVAGGICGTDIGMLNTAEGAAPAGWPLHEVVGEILDPGTSGYTSGQLVVGWAADYAGMRSRLLCEPEQIAAIPESLAGDPLRALIAQPLATVQRAVDRLGPVQGRDAVVLGCGSIGALFVSELLRAGARVTAIDRVDRSDLSAAKGAAHVVAELPCFPEQLREAFDIVIEAIGHDRAVQASAFDLLRQDGTVYLFGVPDDETLTLPLRSVFFRNGTVLTGISTEHRRHLIAALESLVDRPELDDYVTDVFAPQRVDEAYRRAAESDPARLKVALLSAGAAAKPS